MHIKAVELWWLNLIARLYIKRALLAAHPPPETGLNSSSSG